MIQLLDYYLQQGWINPGTQYHVGLNLVQGDWIWTLAPPDSAGSTINPFPASSDMWVAGAEDVTGTCAAIRVGGGDFGATGLVPVPCGTELAPLCMHFVGGWRGGLGRVGEGGWGGVGLVWVVVGWGGAGLDDG